MNISQNPKSKSYNNIKYYQDNSFYIHHHHQNIGKLISPTLDNNDFTEKYKAQRENISYNVKSDYKQRFLESIHLSKVEKQLLSDSMENEETMDSILGALNSSLLESFDQGAKSDAFTKKIEGIENLFNSLDAKKIFEEKNVNELVKYLKAIDKMLNLLNEEGREVAKLLQLNSFNLKGDKQEEDKKFFSVLNTLNNNIEKNFSTIKLTSELQTIVNQIKNIVSVLGEEHKSSISQKQITTTRGFATIASNQLISTNFGEYIFGMIGQGAVYKIDNKIDGICISIEKQRKKGELTGTSRAENSITMKRDVNYKNIKVKMSLKDLDFNMKIDVGLTGKFYRKNIASNGNNKNNKITISSGSGGSLADAIKLTFGDQEIIYLAYNSLVWDYTRKEKEINELTTVIAQRNFVKLWSSAGKGDVAQLFIINGKLYSMYEILNAALKLEVIPWESKSKGNSLMTLSLLMKKTETTGDTTNAHQLLRSENADIAEESDSQPDESKALMRSKKINGYFSLVKIGAHLHFDKISSIIK